MKVKHNNMTAVVPDGFLRVKVIDPEGNEVPIEYLSSEDIHTLRKKGYMIEEETIQGGKDGVQ